MKDYAEPGKHASLVSKNADPNTHLTLAVLHFENAGDFIPTRGPANDKFFERGGNTTYNTCDKSWGVMFKYTIDGKFEIVNRDAYENTDYSGRRRYGPFIIIAHEPDTHYFCIQHVDRFKSLDIVEFSLQAGEVLDTSRWLGWSMAVLNGSVNEKTMGSITTVDTDHAVASADSRIVFAREVDAWKKEAIM